MLTLCRKFESRGVGAIGWLAALALLALWVPAASAGSRAHVSWSGFHGVEFGEPLKAAAQKLHGRVQSDEPRSAAKSVNYPGALVGIGGSLRSEESGGVSYEVRSGSTVGSFLSTSGRVIFPRHTFAGESLARFRHSLGKGTRPERPEHSAAIGYYLVGPDGRTLWAWGSGEAGVLVIGLAESLAGARLDWGNEG